MVERTTDGLGGVYPREMINFSNYAVKAEQAVTERDEEATSVHSLICGNSIRKALDNVSKIKVDSYLSEFPVLQHHFDRFRGQSKADFSQSELYTIMDGLEPSGEEMIKQLHETGVISFSTASALTHSTILSVPRLFRSGLGIVTLGRP